MACRILVHQPGIELLPSTVEAQSPNHWAVKKFPYQFFFELYKKKKVSVMVNLGTVYSDKYKKLREKRGSCHKLGDPLVCPQRSSFLLCSALSFGKPDLMGSSCFWVLSLPLGFGKLENQ